MALSVPIDTRDIAVTPVFKYLTLEDVPASERAGTQIMKTVEAVEVRFAGSKNYSPVFPVSAMYRREGLNVITYAERWADQYAAFLSGNAQRAAGTPLEMLKPLGITDAQLSLCRALKVYSIEALDQMEGPAVKNLGMAANDLKRMASQYVADRSGGGDAAAKIAELEARIAELTRAVPADDPKPAEIEAAVAASDDEVQRLKARYAELTGAKPKGNPGVETLREMVREAEAA